MGNQDSLARIPRDAAQLDARENYLQRRAVEIQVDHKVGIDKSDDAYGQDKLLEQRRPFLELWGEYCSKPAPEPQTGDVVVNLSDKRKRRTA